MATASQQKSFLEKWVPAAQDASLRSGVPASVILAQAILESGWGTSTLATSANNLFGIKRGGSWTGDTITLYDSQERSYSDYRVYDSPADSLRDWYDSVLSQDRFKGARISNPTLSAYGLQAGGYATDPDYAQKLIGVIDTNKLTAFDLTPEAQARIPNMILSTTDARALQIPEYKQGIDALLASGKYTPDQAGNIFVPLTELDVTNGILSADKLGSTFWQDFGLMTAVKGNGSDVSYINSVIEPAGIEAPLTNLGVTVRFLLLAGIGIVMIVALFKMFPRAGEIAKSMTKEGAQSA